MPGRLEQNPFVYGTPLAPTVAIAREREVELVLRLALAGQNTRLSAPRGYGKTTLLAQARAAGDNQGLNTVRVDLQGIRSLGDVAARLEHGFAAAHGPVAGRVLRQVGLRARADVLSASREAEPPRGDIAQRVLFELLDLPLAFHRRTRVRTVVIFDEFQDVRNAGGGVESVIQSCIQHHGSVASYVFGCSSSQILIHRARPLVLGPLSDRVAAPFICKRFARSDRDPAPVLDSLLETAGGHPQRLMLLAHHLWDRHRAATPARSPHGSRRSQPRTPSFRRPSRTPGTALTNGPFSLLWRGAGDLCWRPRRFGISASRRQRPRQRWSSSSAPASLPGRPPASSASSTLCTATGSPPAAVHRPRDGR